LREAAPWLAEPGSGLSRPTWPGGGDDECHPPVDGEPAFGEFEGVAACQPVGLGGAPGGAPGAAPGGGVCAPGIAPALPVPAVAPAGCAPNALGGGADVAGVECQPPALPGGGFPAVGYVPG